MRLFTIILLLSPLFIVAQKKVAPYLTNGTTSTCDGPGRSPLLSQAVCGTLSFTETEVSNCSGPDLPNPTANCNISVSTDNSRWYKFHCYMAGDFGFLITPSSPTTGPTEDYDWEVLDVTGHDLADVYTTELRVSLNLSGQTGKTGCTTSGSLDIHCAGGPPGSQYNQMINLVAGHDYMLMVNNWTAKPGGYKIDFSGSAILTDNALPEIKSVGPVGCDPSKIKVTFTQDILCSTISPVAGTEFTISGGPNTISAIVDDCSIGARSVTSVTLNLSAPLVPGPYTLAVANGSDGNTLKNVCYQEMLPVSGIPFTIDPPVPLNFTNVAFSGCAPTTLNVNLSKSFLCSSITATGSEFFITPGNPAIIAASANCSSGTATDFSIQLQNPLPYGNYTLNVKNGTDGNTITDNCSINMAAGTSIPFVIPQTTAAPVIQSISFDECYPNKVKVIFDKVVLCGSVAANGSDFSVSPGTFTVISATPNCGANTYTNEVLLTLNNNLPAGNFNVNIKTGSDGNTVSDTCFSFIVPPHSKAFVATQSPAPKFDSVQYEKCTPSTIKVFYDHGIFCSSVSADGSDFTITGPSAVSIIGATTDATCVNGYTNWITLQLAAPASVFGTYVLHNKIGTDGNGIIDTCSAAQNPANTISFAVLGLPPAAFNSKVIWACEKDTLIFTHPGGFGINSWHWEFSDGTTDTGQTVRHTFPITTLSVNAKLTVSNGYCDNSSDQDIILGNTFTPLFSYLPKDTACVNSPVTFTDESIGTGLQYLWKFGDTNTFNGQAVPPHNYTASGQYKIDLVLTDIHGCKDTASQNIFITGAAVADFTGLRSQYCAGNQVALKGVFSRYTDSVRWNNGNGETALNKLSVQFTYPNEGIFTISVTGNDHYCGQITTSKTFAVYDVPVVALGKDTVLCPTVNMQIGVPFNPAYNYSWNTGANTSLITTDVFTRKYVLVAENHGCTATDDINIKMLPSCLIAVPNVFTPNGDGVNDKLLALDADLTKSFLFKVYNRLGQLMFSTTDPLQGWDGKFKGNRAENGTYVWELNYINTWTGKAVNEKGTSILMR